MQQRKHHFRCRYFKGPPPFAFFTCLPLRYNRKVQLTDTLNPLEGNSTFTAAKGSVVTVEVNDKDPKRAADMVNTFIEELAKLMQNFALTDGSRIMSPRIN